MSETRTHQLKGALHMDIQWIDTYLESRNRDYDYYLFWADDFESKHWDELVLCQNELKLQIKITHLLMDEGQEQGYQEDGYILGQIIWDSVKQAREKVRLLN